MLLLVLLLFLSLLPLLHKVTPSVLIVTARVAKSPFMVECALSVLGKPWLSSRFLHLPL
jgi:hypothetical protein